MGWDGKGARGGGGVKLSEAKREKKIMNLITIVVLNQILT